MEVINMEIKTLSCVEDLQEMLEENDYVVSKDRGGDIIYLYMNATNKGVEEIKFTIDQAKQLVDNINQIIAY
jgi:hypothetical protein